jgi:hypothetical protein
MYVPLEIMQYMLVYWNSSTCRTVLRTIEKPDRLTLVHEMHMGFKIPCVYYLTKLWRTPVQVILNHWNQIVHSIGQEAMQGSGLHNCVPFSMLFFVLDTWMAWIRLLSAMWAPIFLEPSCHDGPTPTGPQAAPLSLLWTCSMWSLQCRSGLHSCDGFWIWCACLWSMSLWTQRHGVSITVCGLFSHIISYYRYEF